MGQKIFEVPSPAHSLMHQQLNWQKIIESPRFFDPYLSKYRLFLEITRSRWQEESNMLLFSIRAFVELFFLFFDTLWVMGSTVGTMFLLHPNRPPTLRLEELPGGWDAHVICRIYCGPIIPHLFFWRGASWKWLFITQHK